MHFDSLPSKKQEIIERISALPGPKFSVFCFLIGAVRFIVATTILFMFGSVIIQKCVQKASIALQWGGPAIQNWLFFLIVAYIIWTVVFLLVRRLLFKRRKERRLRILRNTSGERVTFAGDSILMEAYYTPSAGSAYARVRCVVPMEKISKVYIDTENERVIIKGNFHIEYGSSSLKTSCIVLYDYFQPMMLPFASNLFNAQYKRIVLLNDARRENLIV